MKCQIGSCKRKGWVECRGCERIVCGHCSSNKYDHGVLPTLKGYHVGLPVGPFSGYCFVCTISRPKPAMTPKWQAIMDDIRAQETVLRAERDAKAEVKTQ